MICPKCGAKLEEGIRVCLICGKSSGGYQRRHCFKRRDLQEYDESDEYDDSNVSHISTRRNSMMILICNDE